MTNEKGIATTISTNAGNRPVDNFILKDNGIIGSTQKNAYVGSLDNNCPSLTAAMGMGGGHIPIIFRNDIDLKDKNPLDEKKILVTTDFNPYYKNNLQIRKLTPKECFKLMGVKPSDYDKLTISKTQKYIQAGNSIVTTCLMAIYSQLFNGVDYRKKIDELLENLK